MEVYGLEEKKAIRGLEWSQQQMRLGNLPDYDQGHYADIRKVLNLIEKQSKEIEELTNEVMEKELIIDGMKEDRRIAVEEIQEQYYVSKDKIKAKIEELEKLNDESTGIGYWFAIYYLQSLLEKE